MAQPEGPNPIVFDLLSGIPHGVSTRHGGVSEAPYASLNMGVSTGDERSSVYVNRARFIRAIGVTPEAVLVARLVHGHQVSVFRSGEGEAWPVNSIDGVEHIAPSDGVASNVPGLSFLMTFADCVPLLFYDPTLGVVGAGHAGWRGTAAQIGSGVVRAMRKEFGCYPPNIIAIIGPSIGRCCYDVGTEVAKTFRQRRTPVYFERRGGKQYLDLQETNANELLAAGLRRENLHVHGACTACEIGTFYSHRAEHGVTGRFALCIGLPQ